MATNFTYNDELEISRCPDCRYVAYEFLGSVPADKVIFTVRTGDQLVMRYGTYPLWGDFALCDKHAEKYKDVP